MNSSIKHDLEHIDISQSDGDIENNKWRYFADDAQKTILQASNEVLVEPTNSKLRPKLIKLIKLLTAHAKQLSKDDLYGSAGADIASTLCGALAWQGANGVDGDDWINEKNEPVLFALMSVSSALIYISIIPVFAFLRIIC